MTIINYLAIIGFILSAYMLYVEIMSMTRKYKPICDISERVSCTKAINSQYGKLLGIPNSAAGMIYYPVIIILQALNKEILLFYLAILGMAVTAYLAYSLLFKLKNLCLVCIAIYIINILVLYAAA